MSNKKLTPQEVADRIIDSLVEKTGLTKEEIRQHFKERLRNGTLLKRRKPKFNPQDN